MLGCGALGLTAARLAQQAGAKVTIYARDLLPDTRSARATGTWTPDSRIALADKVAPDFPALELEVLAAGDVADHREDQPAVGVERARGLHPAPAPVGVEDPAERLAAVQERMGAIKRSHEGQLAYAILSAIGRGPAMLEATLIEFFTAA